MFLLVVGLCVYAFNTCSACVYLCSGKNIYNGEHVAIKLVSVYFVASTFQCYFNLRTILVNQVVSGHTFSCHFNFSFLV